MIHFASPIPGLPCWCPRDPVKELEGSSLLTNNDVSHEWAGVTAGRQSVTFQYSKNYMSTLIRLSLRTAFPVLGDDPAIAALPAEVASLISFSPPLPLPYSFHAAYDTVTLKFDDVAVNEASAGVSAGEKESALFLSHFFALATEYRVTVAAGFPSKYGLSLPSILSLSFSPSFSLSFLSLSSSPPQRLPPPPSRHFYLPNTPCVSDSDRARRLPHQSGGGRCRGLSLFLSLSSSLCVSLL